MGGKYRYKVILKGQSEGLEPPLPLSQSKKKDTTCEKKCKSTVGLWIGLKHKEWYYTIGNRNQPRRVG
jgi:hypothetical protein